MSENKSDSKAENNRPSWAQNMDDETWQKNYAGSSTSDVSEKTPQDTTISHETNIQEEHISASVNMDENKKSENENLSSGSDKPKNLSSSTLPSKEDIEAAIVKTPASEDSKTTEQTTAKADDHKQDKKPSLNKTKSDSAKPEPAPSRPKFSYAKDEAELPVRGYGVLSFLPLLTLTILLSIHVISFIFSHSNEIILENPAQIQIAQQLAADGSLFIPTLDGEVIKDVSPVQLWYLGGIFKFIPVSDAMKLHIAGAFAAFLLLCAVYFFSKTAVPGNKGVAFSAGLILISCVFYLGSAWFFRPEILAVALITFSQALLLKGLLKPNRAYLQLLLAMILAALAVLAGGLVMAFALFIPLALYPVITGNYNRFASSDLTTALVVYVLILGGWLAGAVFFNGSEKVAAYALPIHLTIGADFVGFSLNEKITFAALLILPWLLVPFLLIDSLFARIMQLGTSLKTEDGKGTLFLACALIAAIAIIAIDRLNHPLIAIVLIPALSILIGRAVLYMSRARARIFIIFTAFIMAVITILLVLYAVGMGKTILPWEVSLGTNISLIGAALFCTLFLARAAQVSAGKTLLLGYAICWLFIAQVFLFTGLPAALPHLTFAGFDTKGNYQIALLDTPAWAGIPQQPQAKIVNSWEEIQKMAEVAPTLAVLPESYWQSLDKKQYPFKLASSQYLMRTQYVLVQSGQIHDNLLVKPTLELAPKAPIVPIEDAIKDKLFSNSTKPDAVMENALPAIQTTANNATLATDQEKPAEQTTAMPAEIHSNATAVTTTQTDEQPSEQKQETIATPDQGPVSQNLTDPGTEQNKQEQIQPPSPVSENPKVSSASPAVAMTSEASPTPKPSVTAEETVLTTFTPKVTPNINLWYGSISGPPEFSITVRYHYIRAVN